MHQNGVSMEVGEVTSGYVNVMDLNWPIVSQLITQCNTDDDAVAAKTRRRIGAVEFRFIAHARAAAFRRTLRRACSRAPLFSGPARSLGGSRESTCQPIDTVYNDSHCLHIQVTHDRPHASSNSDPKAHSRCHCRKRHAAYPGGNLTDTRVQISQCR
jgi:hypothetical protein